MTLPDGLQLGSTCRRLYALYRDSYKNRQSLVLYTFEYYDRESSYLFGSRKVPPITDHLKMRKLVPTTRKLINLLPNLLFLEIDIIMDYKRNIPYLAKALNNSPIATKLKSLKLNIYSRDSPKRTKEFATEELRLPSLKHLSVCFTDDREILSEEGDSVEHVLNSPLFHSVLPQLTSFHIMADSSHANVYHFVHEHVCTNDQLVAAAGTESLQVAFDATYHFDEEDFNFNLLELYELDNQTLNCDYCDYRNNKDTDIAQKCGLKLARGLLRLGTGDGWQSQVKVKKMVASFYNLSPSVKYSSLANLVAGIKD
ncbi:hypothetical protein TYRP_016109 [Tyrophagus putrescentiae]|nr:hypothetical protein TYRP_016109 [Tyrophagus putrescentiae]